MWAVIPVWNPSQRSMKAQQMGTLCQHPGGPFSVQDSNSAAACWWITRSHGELSSARRRQAASICFTQSLSELEEALRSFVTVAVQQCRSTLSMFYWRNRTKAHLLKAPQVKALIMQNDLLCKVWIFTPRNKLSSLLNVKSYLTRSKDIMMKYQSIKMQVIVHFYTYLPVCTVYTVNSGSTDYQIWYSAFFWSSESVWGFISPDCW